MLAVIAAHGAATERSAAALPERAAATPELDVVTVTIEGSTAPGIAYVLREGGELLLDTGTLARLGLPFEPSAARHVDGRTVVPVSTITGLRWRMVEQEQRLVLSHEPDARPLSNIPFGQAASSRPLTPDWGGYVNYGVYSSPAIDGARLQGAGNTLGGSLAASIFGPHGIGTTSALVNAQAVADAASPRVVFLDTNWRWDDLGKLRTLLLGDGIAAPGWWGQAIRFGGIQFSSNYTLQPGFVTYPLLAAGGLATAPSTTDILVNDVRVGSQAVPTGPFSITNIPTISGAGELNLVVRDAFGQQRVISQPFYVAQQLLKPGLTEFSISAGAERLDYGIRNFDYGQGYASSLVRHGLTSHLTAEARAEVDRDSAAAGLGADLLVGRLGVFSAGVAVSRSDGRSGAKYLLGFDRQGRSLVVGARATRATSSYAEIGEPRPRVSDTSTIFFRAPLGDLGTLGVGYSGQRYFAASPVNVTTATFSRNLFANAFLTLSISRYSSTRAQTQALALIAVPLDRLTTATGSILGTRATDGDGTRAEALVQRSLPLGNGFGYYARAHTDRLVAGGVSYANAVGRYSLEASTADGTTALRASATGAIAWIGSDVLAGQSIEQAFAVVRVADLDEVRILQEHQDAGRTHEGRLALTRIPPLNPIKIAIDPVSVPMDMSLDATVREVVLLPRTGVLVDFKATRERAALVSLVLPTGAPVPAGATVVIDGRSEVFPVGHDGEVYLTRLSGRQTLTARINGSQCRLELVLDAGAAHSNVGPLVCDATRQ